MNSVGDGQRKGTVEGRMYVTGLMGECRTDHTLFETSKEDKVL